MKNNPCLLRNINHCGFLNHTCFATPYFFVLVEKRPQRFNISYRSPRYYTIHRSLCCVSCEVKATKIRLYSTNTPSKYNAPAPALFHKKTKGYTSTHKGEARNMLRKKVEPGTPRAHVEKPRHYPPANKEWFNSIYTYGKATQKLAPTLDKVTQKLVKGYLDFYSDKLEGRVKPITKRMRR